MTAQGRVVLFDEHRGLGEVADETDERYPFHCVEIADASRTIAVGTAITFDLRRKLGRLEAVRITP